ncbi:putative late blight resistance protein homolog R1B-13 [Nicotiana tomentosiformis]|uniref:putative late blight resistance protein homolog R1B-13 n=1 Tax=Nicotiana tomentosiformis TaxID=4098 RepID=UPI00388C3B48
MYANTSSSHEMNLLTLENSWKLLRDKVFGPEKDYPPELEKIGKKIVEKCQGLPLTISVIAGHLSKMDMTLESWKDVARTLGDIVASQPDKCLGVLEAKMTKFMHMERDELPVPTLPKEKHIVRRFSFQTEHHSVDACRDIPESISELQNLQTLINHGGKGMPNLEELSGLCSLSCTTEVFSRIPNLKRLVVYEISSRREGMANRLIDMSNLTKLVTLKCWEYDVPKPISIKMFVFPTSLKRLTLYEFRFPWKDISTLAMLPNLEELKLKYNAVKGGVWRLSDEDKFESLKLLLIATTTFFHHWEASSDNFPNLKRLVLNNCHYLKQIPTDFGEICSLESIELHYCNTTAEDSARKIKQEQQDM